jgi:hypothetical protein
MRALPELSKRLRDTDYAETCRARLNRDHARSGPPNPTTSAISRYDPVAVVTQPRPVGSKSLLAALLRHPFLASSMLAAVLTLPLAAAVDLPELVADVRWAAANMTSGADVVESRNGPIVHAVSASAPTEGIYDAAAEPEAHAEPPTEFASLETAVRTSGGVAPPVAPEPPPVTVPEVAPVLVDATQTSAPEQAQQPRDPAVAAHSGPASALAPADRDLLVQRGEEMLARGDVSGARLLFRRAAESGDARAAFGLALTFDPKVLGTLRAYGVRPDPDQAAFWYARSKALATTASQ